MPRSQSQLRSLLVLLLLLLSSPSLAHQPPHHNKRDTSHPPYLSSSIRQAPPRSFGLFSYARNPADLGPYDALLEVQNVLLHRGLTTARMGDSVIRPLNQVSGDVTEVGASQGSPGILEGAGPGLAVPPIRGGQVLWSYEGQNGQSPRRAWETKGSEARDGGAGATIPRNQDFERQVYALGRRYDDGMWHPEAPGGGAAYDDGQWHGAEVVNSQSWSEEQVGAESVETGGAEDMTSGGESTEEVDSAVEAQTEEAAVEAEEQPTAEQPQLEQPAVEWSEDSPPPDTPTTEQITAPSDTSASDQATSTAAPSFFSDITGTSSVVNSAPAPEPATTSAGPTSTPSLALTATSDDEDDGEWEWVEDDGSPMPECDNPPPSVLSALAQMLDSSKSEDAPPGAILSSSSSSPPRVSSSNTSIAVPTTQPRFGYTSTNSSIRIGRRSGDGYDVMMDRGLHDVFRTNALIPQKRRKQKDQDKNGNYGKGGGNSGGGRHGHRKDESEYGADDDARGSRHRSGGYDDGRYNEEWQNDKAWNDDEDGGGRGSTSRTEEYESDTKARPNRHGETASDNADDEDDYRSSISSDRSKKHGSYGAGSASQQNSEVSLGDDCRKLAQFYDAMGGEEWNHKAGWEDGGDTNCCRWYGVTCQSASTGPSGGQDRWRVRGWKDDYGDEYGEHKAKAGKGEASEWDDEAGGRHDEDASDDENNSGRAKGGGRKSKGADEQWGRDGEDDGDDWPGSEHGGRGSATTQARIGAGRVIALALAQNGLKGPLSDALFAIESLQRIDVSNNAVTSLPDSFASLPHLTHFKAANNSLTGPVPSSLRSSLSLTNLNLANTSLSGDLSLSIPELLSVSLSNNQLSSISIVAPKIQRVYLANNAFTGPLPDLSQARGLTTFIASNNSFTGSLFDLSGLTNLTHFDVRANGLTGLLPTSFSSLKILESLYLSSNQLTGSVPSESAPSLLTSCSIQPNPITCPSDADLSDPQSLASRCHASCRRPQKAGGAGSRQTRPAGMPPIVQNIPVAPLPGEAGQAQSQSPAQAPGNPQGPGALAAPSPLGVPQLGLLPPKVVSPAVGSGFIPLQSNGNPPAGGAATGPAQAVHPLVGENMTVRVPKGSAVHSVGISAGVAAVSLFFTIMTTMTTFAT